ncbi:MAG: AhpC/TSA family protein [Marinilabiliaceae bacterium]|nr:AhpC/TSA family protein [Marinilabiliaceae bacterium]
MKHIFLTLILLSAFTICAQTVSGSYEIKVKVKGFEEQDLILGYHFRKALHVKDTAQFDKNGFATFKGTEPLPGGIYLFYFPNGKYYEILIDKEQHFSVESDSIDFIKNAKIKGAKEVEQFFEMQKFLDNKGKIMGNYREEFQNVGDNQQKKDELSEKMNLLNEEVREYRKKLETDNEGKFISALIKALNEPLIPEFEIPEDTHNRDSVLYFTQMSYIKNHFFDNIDLTDNRMLRTPFFHQKIEQYFNSALVQIPDTVADAAIMVIEKSKSNNEMFRYLVPVIYNLVNESKVMGMEAAMVAIAEKYYLSGLADWATEEFITDLRKRVTDLKPTLLGQTAHDLKMESPHGEFFRLHEINAKITIIVFYEPDCGHCKKEIPKLYNDVFLKYREKGVQVFAVYNLVDKEQWTKFIDENSIYDWINVYDPYQQTHFRQHFDIKSTPVIYVLDKDKKIIAKKIETEQLPDFLDFILK